MAKSVEQLKDEVRNLRDAEKPQLVDAILVDLDKPDPEIDQVWAEEARRRWAAYKSGGVRTTSYSAVMDKHRHT
jgi:hypothetical protein